MNERVPGTAFGAASRGHGVRVTLGIAVVAAFMLVSVSLWALTAEPGQVQSVHVVAVVDGLVTVHVRDALLSEVLDEIAGQTGLRIEGHASMADRITIELDQLSLEDALRLILDDQRYALYYVREALPDGETVRVPQRLRIFPDEADVRARSGSVDDTAEASLDADTIEASKMRTVLKSSDDPWDREDAVEALAESEQPDVAVPLLRVALTDRDEYVRLAAIEALATLGGDRAVEALEMALRDKDVVIREEAIETLEAIGGEQAARSLTVALQDAHLREQAVDALGNIASPIALQFLEHAWAGDSDDAVRAAAWAWLEALLHQNR